MSVKQIEWVCPVPSFVEAVGAGEWLGKKTEVTGTAGNVGTRAAGLPPPTTPLLLIMLTILGCWWIVLACWKVRG